MTLVSLADVKAARAQISGKAYRTPLVHSKNLSAMLGVELYLKLEPMQKTGSFKVRGAINKVAALSDDERKNLESVLNAVRSDAKVSSVIVAGWADRSRRVQRPSRHR